jgi:hypothetical protein
MLDVEVLWHVPKFVPMSAEIGQFDDALSVSSIGVENPELERHFVDENNALWSQESEQDLDDLEDSDDEDLEEYDNNRVEDEDWEIAERGATFFLLFGVCVAVSFDRFHQAI